MNGERDNETIGKNIVVEQSFIKDARDYFIKAIIAVAALTLIGKFAPNFPSFSFPFIFLAYALPSTIGAMYYVVTNRFHRQLRFNEKGKLSSFNRKWFVWLLGFFIFFLFSGFFFVLEAPEWDNLEWLLVWLAVPFYYIVFLFAQRAAKKELAPKFYKASAIKWSFFITVIVLSIIYAFMPVQAPWGDSATLEEALRNPLREFDISSCALLNEADKLSSFTDTLVTYGLNQIAVGSLAIAIVVRFVLCLSVFLGLVNIFSFCLLNWQEAKSVFQLLPVDEQEYANNSQPTMKRYFLVIAGIWLVLALLFLGFEYEISKATAVAEHTAVDTIIDDLQKRTLRMTPDGMKEIDKLKEQDEERQTTSSDYREEFDRITQDKEINPKDQIEEYYNQCINNLDSYLDWYDGFGGRVTKIIKPLGKQKALDKFRELVIDPVDKSGLEDKYAQYIDKLYQNHNEYLSKMISTDPNAPSKEPASAEANEKELELWECLNSENESFTVNDTLLNTDKNTDRSTHREKLIGLINKERDRVLRQLNEKTNEYRPQNDQTDENNA
ncbi:hypothetical protein [Adlercreutzia sp. ZJ141]|uniref:hypothetical protein n=1 Tax=Adlercreutzia sp. ZJ141 TaxID=2709406 RepID=UPI0013EBF230|nr:hypothetical protein [Adlercreutzia sp. ZJ141]